MQKMFEAYKSYGAITNCKECRNCWAMNMCSYCAALRLDGGKWTNPRVSECDLQRRSVEYQLKLFVALYKLDPDFMPKLTIWNTINPSWIITSLSNTLKNKAMFK